MIGHFTGYLFEQTSVAFEELIATRRRWRWRLSLFTPEPLEIVERGGNELLSAGVLPGHGAGEKIQQISSLLGGFAPIRRRGGKQVSYPIRPVEGAKPSRWLPHPPTAGGDRWPSAPPFRDADPDRWAFQSCAHALGPTFSPRYLTRLCAATFPDVDFQEWRRRIVPIEAFQRRTECRPRPRRISCLS